MSEEPIVSQPLELPNPPRRKGRPPGSKNKYKPMDRITFIKRLERDFKSKLTKTETRVKIATQLMKLYGWDTLKVDDNADAPASLKELLDGFEED